ncbi:hypothetical protein SteCoe_30977 [Stentor coeruleus]|uniref:MORN repeat protein n=1 Tax=Stentor coeruleus TaxID=5963 RepID=A0A1R2B2U2_9CILI|nr:hypothetical protein SteCoe_30977 [Stentor coeruleus]
MGNNNQKQSKVYENCVDSHRKIKKNLSFSGIKNIVQSSYFSCLCSKNEEYTVTESSPRFYNPQRDLASLSRGYLARKLRSQIYKEYKIVNNIKNFESKESNMKYVSTENTLDKDFKLKTQMIKDPSYNLYDTVNYEDVESLDQSSESPPNTYSIPYILLSPFKNPLNQYCELKNNRKELDHSEESFDEDDENQETSIEKTDKHGLKTDNDSIYYGELKDGIPNGQGIEKWSDGKFYEGQYINGLRTGQGVFIWPDQSYYKGDFIDNDMEGFGIFKWGNGNLYEGTWKKSKMHGQGKYIWSDKNIYVGGYENGLKHGDGVFIWPDGKQMRGTWREGKIQAKNH